jgi:hypothetical protein
MRKGIVWTAIFSVVAAGCSIISAVMGNSDYVLAYGLVSIASALLASREK